jgi:MarR family transcriptional regulator, organic hydroperoxide resistance regulator
MPEFLELHSKTSKLLRAAADAAVQRHGLRLGQDHLLAALWAEDGRTPGEIAAAVNVTTPAVTKLATRMAEAGWLERRPDPHDNRLVRLWLTPAGRALQKPIEAERQALEDRITATLTKTERTQLIKALTKISQALADAHLQGR